MFQLDSSFSSDPAHPTSLSTSSSVFNVFNHSTPCSPTAPLSLYDSLFSTSLLRNGSQPIYLSSFLLIWSVFFSILHFSLNQNMLPHLLFSAITSESFPTSCLLSYLTVQLSLHIIPHSISISILFVVSYPFTFPSSLFPSYSVHCKPSKFSDT